MSDVFPPVPDDVTLLQALLVEHRDEFWRGCTQQAGMSESEAFACLDSFERAVESELRQEARHLS